MLGNFQRLGGFYEGITQPVGFFNWGSGALTAQAAHAQATTDCSPPVRPQLCVEFDASRSVDPAISPVVYHGQMGDSATLTSLTASHCYKRRARYQVVLDVLLPATGEVRPTEKTIEADLVTQPVINFSLPAKTIHVGEAVVFDALASGLPTCQNLVYIWDFRAGLTQQGRRIAHVFRKAGHYQVRLSLRGYGPGSCAASHCASQ